MNIARLFKLTTPVRQFVKNALHQSLAGVMVFSLVITPKALAADAAQGPSFQLNQTDKCTAAKDKMDNAAAEFAGTCNEGGTGSASEIRTCVKQLLECKDAEKQAAEAISDEGTDGDTCRDIAAKGCAAASATSSSASDSDKKEARKARKELEKDRDKESENASKDAEKAQEQSNALDDKAAEEDEKYPKNRKEITDKLQKDLADIDDAKLKATKDAQEQYDKLDVQYITMRDKLRRLQSSTSQLDLSWKVQCRNAADTSARDSEKQLDERTAAEDKIATNYQLSSAAGRNRRILKQKRKKILNLYNQVLNKCLKGDIAPGAESKLALDKANNELHDEQSSSADVAARLEKLRLQIVESMNQLEQSLQKKQAMIVQQANEALQLLDKAHAAAVARIEKKKQQDQMQQMMKQMQSMQKGQKQAKDLKDAKDEELNASARSMCKIGSEGSNGPNSTSYKKQNAARTKIDRSCADIPNNPECGLDKVFGQLCNDVKAAKTLDAKKSGSGGSRSSSVK